jgi:DNA-binding YbaB/EbfC family protein
MFDKFKAMGQMAALFKDKEKLRDAARRIKDKAAETRVTGESGAGAVRVTADGQMRVLSVEVQPALVMGMAADEKTRELAGNLIAEAVNEAIKSAQEAMKAVIHRECKDMGLPDLPSDIGSFLS